MHYHILVKYLSTFVGLSPITWLFCGLICSSILVLVGIALLFRGHRALTKLAFVIFRMHAICVHILYIISIPRSFTWRCWSRDSCERTWRRLADSSGRASSRHWDIRQQETTLVRDIAKARSRPPLYRCYAYTNNFLISSVCNTFNFVKINW